MSSSSRSLLTAAAAAAGVMSCAAFDRAVAGEWFFQPKADVRAETNSNRDLNPNVSTSLQGYMADLQGTIGYSTPRSDTTAVPRIHYQYYQDRPDLKNFEEFLDLHTNYRTLRSQLDVVASVDQRDAYTAELADSNFDETGQPVSPTTGRLVVGDKRDHFMLGPQYTYQFTPIISAGMRGTFESVRYSEDTAFRRVDYNYGEANAFVRWALSPSTTTSLGALANHYHALDDTQNITAYGATADLTHKWSDVTSATLQLRYEKDDTSNKLLNPTDFSSSGVGVMLGYTRTGLVDRIRFSAGRSFDPSGTGGKKTTDLARAQYDRNFTPRWTGTASFVVLRDRAIDQSTEVNDRNYAQAQIFAKWMMTRYWYVGGGYMYTWQKYLNDANHAANNTVYLTFGYEGLGRTPGGVTSAPMTPR